VNSCGCCRGQQREPTTPATSTRSGEAPEQLLDGVDATARRVEGGGGARVTAAWPGRAEASGRGRGIKGAAANFGGFGLKTKTGQNRVEGRG
jgi:hypothetical protein